MDRRSLGPSAVSLQLLFLRMGWLPLVGLLAAVIASTLHFGLTPLSRQRAHTSQQLITEMRLPHSELKDEYGLVRGYSEFRARLASVDNRGNLLKSLFALAGDASVSLFEADYRSQSLPACGCQELRITFPVRGTYLDVRKFIDAALISIPALSLEEINFHRDSVKNSAVDAKLQITIYFLKDD